MNFSNRFSKFYQRTNEKFLNNLTNHKNYHRRKHG